MMVNHVRDGSDMSDESIPSLEQMDALEKAATPGPWNSYVVDYWGSNDSPFIDACRQWVPFAIAEIRRLREYEAATRDTICWDVKCRHIAAGLNLSADAQAKLDAANTRIQQLERDLKFYQEKLEK